MSTTYDLTKRQKEILDFVIHEIETRGIPPSLREIRDAMHMKSFQGAAAQLKALEQKGYIARLPYARGIRVLKKSSGFSDQVGNTLSIPLLGEVHAGLPMLAEENIEKYVAVGRQALKGAKQAFLLRVRGDSMVNAGIFEGDIAIISSQSTAENGDIVVALLENEVTLKRFHRVDQYVALLPANEKYSPIIGKAFSIQGKCIGLLRNQAGFNEHATMRTLLPVYAAKS